MPDLRDVDAVLEESPQSLSKGRAKDRTDLDHAPNASKSAHLVATTVGSTVVVRPMLQRLSCVTCGEWPCWAIPCPRARSK